MKSVADIGELRRVAASIGATAHVGTNTFNAQRTRMTAVRAPAPAAEADQIVPPPAPPAATQEPVAAMMQALVPTLAKLLVDVAQAVRDTAPRAAEPPPIAAAPAVLVAPTLLPTPTTAPLARVALPARVEFTVLHDADGLMTAVHASAGNRSITFEIARDHRSHEVEHVVAPGSALQIALTRNADKRLCGGSISRNSQPPFDLTGVPTDHPNRSHPWPQ